LIGHRLAQSRGWKVLARSLRSPSRVEAYAVARARLGQLSKPSGLSTDSSGDVYIADSGNDRIQKMSPSGRVLGAWGKQDANRIQKLSANGTTDNIWGPGLSLKFPEGIAFDHNGSIYVSDTGNNRIDKNLYVADSTRNDLQRLRL
jgi:sugar lactone lactonase YvrE